MKNKFLLGILCLAITLITTACDSKLTSKPTTLEDTYKAVQNYFGNDKVDKSNLSLYYLDEEDNIIVVELIDNSEERQEEFLSTVNIDSKYIKFEQGKKNYTYELDVDIEKSVDVTCGNIEFNKYLDIENRTIYLEENLKDMYIIDNKNKMTLKYYLSNVNQSVDNSVKAITNNFEKEEFKDGGTTVYKNKDKDITIIACNTLKGVKDIYIGDYGLTLKDNMCK